PAGMSAEIAKRLESEVKLALQRPDIVMKLNELGITAIGSSPGELKEAILIGNTEIGALTRSLGIEPN
ncbi:MAG: hypothetical protein NTV56_01515, partial [Alphaproteobacteria bacterium]|nr:hypothetical protein [Alphaproteobacteria bacterium]